MYYPDGFICFVGFPQFADYSWRRNDFREKNNHFFALFDKPVKVAVDYLVEKSFIVFGFQIDYAKAGRLFNGSWIKNGEIFNFASNITKIEITQIAPRKIILAYTSKKYTKGVDKTLPKSPPACVFEITSIIPRLDKRKITPPATLRNPIAGTSLFINENPNTTNKAGRSK